MAAVKKQTKVSKSNVDNYIIFSHRAPEEPTKPNKLGYVSVLKKDERSKQDGTYAYPETTNEKPDGGKNEKPVGGKNKYFSAFARKKPSFERKPKSRQQTDNRRSRNRRDDGNYSKDRRKPSHRRSPRRYDESEDSEDRSSGAEQRRNRCSTALKVLVALTSLMVVGAAGFLTYYFAILPNLHGTTTGLGTLNTTVGSNTTNTHYITKVTMTTDKADQEVISIFNETVNSTSG